MRLLGPIYALLGYLGFCMVAAYLVAFLNDLGVPHTVSRGPDPGSVPAAVLVDAGMLVLVGVQHAVMARRWFKRAWSRLFSIAFLRSTFVWTANLTFVLLFLVWRPIPGSVWSVDDAFAVGALNGLQASGWLLAFGSTFAIGHLQMFGVAQVWRWWQRRRQPAPRLQVGFFYRVVRHPLMLGLLVGFWATPEMTWGRLVFALTMTAFVAIAVPLEERKLARELGPAYVAYRREVPMLLPLRFGADSATGEGTG